MKRNISLKLIGAAAMSLLLLFAFAATASAASSAAYNGSYAGSLFGFYPNDGSSGTGLFPDLQNLMPGGSYSQTVTVTNSSYEQANLYLRGEPDSATVPADLLSKVTFKVTDETGKVIVPEGTPMAAAWPSGGTGTNTGTYAYLGTFTNGTTRTLTVTLSVPAALGNAYQNAKGVVKWVFQADVYEPYNPPSSPTPTSTIPLGPGITIETGTGTKIPLSPGTGDDTNYLLWGAGCVALAVVLAVLIHKRRKA